jgi:hypothetical protein
MMWGHEILSEALGKCFGLRKATCQFLREAKILFSTTVFAFYAFVCLQI